jgi:hypothetical protein
MGGFGLGDWGLGVDGGFGAWQADQEAYTGQSKATFLGPSLDKGTHTF